MQEETVGRNFQQIQSVAIGRTVVDFAISLLQTLAMDGGSSRFKSGDFNALTQLTSEQWDEMEKLIRKNAKKDKARLQAKL